MADQADFDLKGTWNQALGNLQGRLRDDEYEHWIRPMVPVQAADGQVEISVPNRMFASWVQEKYMTALANAWVEASGRATDFTFTWNQDRLQGELFGAEELGDVAENSVAAESAGLVPRYDFSSFVVGSNNQFARAAAMAVVGRPGALYNPFFVYGRVGLGKTHLANAIGNAILEQHPSMRVKFMSSESFTNQLIDAIAGNRAQSFKNRMRQVDVLVVDDVQFLAGRERTQEEFFHVFNALYESGRQIILTSDKFPNELDGVEERLCNRFAWGLVADIQPPDIETRMAILDRRARDEDIDLPMDVASLIAEKVDSNVRELEGALTRLVAYSSLNSQPITRQLADELLADMAPSARPAVTLEEIERAVATQFGLDPGELCGRRRTKNVAEARQVCMFLMRRHAAASYPAIGRHLGGRDHSTAIHACQSIENRITSDQKFRRIVDTIARNLGCV